MVKKVIKPLHYTPGALQPVFNFTLRTKYIFLGVIAFIFYANTLPNKYAFDDELAITKNAYVQMGFKGIPKILTSDSYASYYTYLSGNAYGVLAAGRYRPLSEVIFAIERQLFGDSALLPCFCHLVNVLAYVACILAIFYFLHNFLLKKITRGKDMAFLSAFLFIIHPIHTEVVANIKSLDEILSLLFILLTFIFGLRYLERRKNKHLFIAISSFLLALLSKEYAIALLFFIPYLFFLLENKKLSTAVVATIPYFGVAVFYLMMRYNAVGFHTHTLSSTLAANPYLYATPAQKIATQWFVLGKYLGLLFYPCPLSSDYSYNQLPYHSFSDITVLFSILIYTVIFAGGVKLTLQKSVLAFAVFFFLFTILIISNFVLDIGATMGERLVFHSSLGFSIILSYYLFRGISTVPPKTGKKVGIGIMAFLGTVCFGETVTRNAQWKNDTTLFIHDVNISPASFLLNANAGWSYLSLSEKIENAGEHSKIYLDSAKILLLRSLGYYPEYDIAYLNLGAVYMHLGLFDSAKFCLDMVEKLNPDSPELKSKYTMLSQVYFSRGVQLATDSGKPFEGAINFKKALSIDSVNPEIWYDIGLAYFQLQFYDSARYAFQKTLQYRPDSTDAINAEKGLQVLSGMKEQ